MLIFTTDNEENEATDTPNPAVQKKTTATEDICLDMTKFSDDEVLDHLLSALSQRGPAGFNVYFVLEDRYGRLFAESRLNFFNRMLEYHELAKQGFCRINFFLKEPLKSRNLLCA